jgi:hypothetical protein
LPYGLNQNAITTIAGIYGHHSSSCMYYSIKAWDNKKLCHIEFYTRTPNRLCRGSNELDEHFKQYDTTETDIEQCKINKMIEFDTLLIELIKILGGAIIVLFALMGYELYLKYKQNKDRHGL